MKTIHRYSVVIALVLFVFENSSTFAESSKVNYDTAWTFVYDGGVERDGKTEINDVFYGAVALPNGTVVCAGKSGDTVINIKSIIVKLDSKGSVIDKKLYVTNNTTRPQFNGESVHSVFRAKNGDLLVGGERFLAPWIMRIDSTGLIKWSTWFYDSTKGLFGDIFNKSAVVNSIRETSRGTIICAAGNEFPNNGNSSLDNYSAFMELTANGEIKDWGESINMTGYKNAGFCIDEDIKGRYLLSGNQSVICIDTNGAVVWKKKYGIMLDGVGSMVNNVSKAKMLRNSALMVIGQTYEGNCWTNYKALHFDAWWSRISDGQGDAISRDTAGRQGGSDALYDFTQLIDGNIVFVGTKATPVDSGVWVFVTDSTGEKFLWERQYDLPGEDAGGNKLKTLLPLSVCATPDSGFTVVGDNNTFGNNHNAFAIHFIPVAPVKATQPKAKALAAPAVRYRQTGSEVQFTTAASYSTAVIVSVSGKLVAEIVRTGATLRWDCSRVASGVYQYRLLGNTKELSGTLVVR